MVCPVDASGKFTEEVSDYQGVYVKVTSVITHNIQTQHYCAGC